MTKTDLVLDYMKSHNGITPMEAIKEFNAYRLGSIIYNLRYKRGIKIDTIIEQNKTNGKVTSQYARYVLSRLDDE